MFAEECSCLLLWFVVDEVSLHPGTKSLLLDLVLSSIIPCLALKGVASAIAASKTLKAKVLLRMLRIYFLCSGT